MAVWEVVAAVGVAAVTGWSDTSGCCISAVSSGTDSLVSDWLVSAEGLLGFDQTTASSCVI